MSVHFWLRRRPTSRVGSLGIDSVRIVLPLDLETSFVSKIGLMVETEYVLGWVPPTCTHHTLGTQCVLTGACLRSYKLRFLFWLRLCVC